MAEQPTFTATSPPSYYQNSIQVDSSAIAQSQPSTATAGLKRRASSSFGGMQDDCRKRAKEEQDSVENGSKERVTGSVASTSSSVDLVEDLYQELQCGCCSDLIYKPVVVAPCQHFFCGSCIALWIRNGGTNCPACRSESSIVSPSRPLQVVIDSLLRAAPHKGRSERERQQADEVYKGNVSMRIPTPREASPEPNLNISAEYTRPCPHCSPHNPYRWTCPQPIPDPNTDIDRAWHVEDGIPPGHGHCGNWFGSFARKIVRGAHNSLSEVLLALQAPTTTKCDFCYATFCGIAVPGRCAATTLASQHLHGISDISDIIQCQDVYECFNGNTVEVDFMLDHLTAQNLTPRHIYREIVDFIRAQPRLFAPLIEQDLFLDGALESDANPEAPRERTCRRCATEIFLWGLKDWWIRERQKGFVDAGVALRRDCPDGSDCTRQKDLGHAKEFNHIFGATPSSLPKPIVAVPSQGGTISTNGIPSSSQGSASLGIPPSRMA